MDIESALKRRTDREIERRRRRRAIPWPRIIAVCGVLLLVSLAGVLVVGLATAHFTDAVTDVQAPWGHYSFNGTAVTFERTSNSTQGVFYITYADGGTKWMDSSKYIHFSVQLTNDTGKMWMTGDLTHFEDTSSTPTLYIPDAKMYGGS
jgi:hypothetical protein